MRSVSTEAVHAVVASVGLIIALASVRVEDVRKADAEGAISSQLLVRACRSNA